MEIRDMHEHLQLHYADAAADAGHVNDLLSFHRWEAGLPMNKASTAGTDGGDSRGDSWNRLKRPKAPENVGSSSYLARFGTAIFVFGILFSQTKGPDRVPDLIIFGTATWLFACALLVGRLGSRHGKAASEWRNGPVSTVVLAIALILSLNFIRDLVIYELHRQ